MGTIKLKDVRIGLDDIAAVISDTVQAELAGLRDEVAAIKKDLAEFKYVGAFESGKTYQKGNFVTHHGSTWHCNCPTVMPPGDGGSSWTLTAKKGRDAK